MTKTKKHSLCTILRTVKVSHGKTNVMTGKYTEGRSEIVDQPCGTPLFDDARELSGICRSCSEGWEVKGNHFANDQEKARATKGGAR